MMEDLKNLYQDVILDHSNSPRNFGVITPHSHQGHGHNPLCGDTVTLYANVNKNATIEDISFAGKGCAISMASASLLTQIVKGKSIQQAQELFEQFHTLLTSEDADDNAALEEMQVLAGVKQFPMRVKCATLSWHALKEAMSNHSTTLTDEGE